MKVTCLQENLSKALNLVGQVVPKGKVSDSRTQDVLLETEGEHLRICGTDLSTTVTIWIDSIVGEEGKVTASHKYMSDLVSSLPRDKLDLGIKGNDLVLACGKSVAKLRLSDAEKFPIPQTLEGGKTIIIPAKLLKAGLAVDFATAKDSARPTLSGVKVDVVEEGVVFAAADGYMLAVRELEMEAFSIPSVIIPGSIIGIVKSLVGSMEESVAVSVGSGYIVFQLPSFEISSPLLAGEFPHYRDFLPAKYPCQVTVNRQELLRAAKSATVLPVDQRVVWLTASPSASPGTLTVRSKSKEVGDYESVLSAIVNVPGKVALNGEQLAAALGSMDSDSIVIEVKGVGDPVLLREGEDYKVVIMPVLAPELD